jgi:hypothetical protein
MIRYHDLSHKNKEWGHMIWKIKELRWFSDRMVVSSAEVQILVKQNKIMKNLYLLLLYLAHSSKE